MGCCAQRKATPVSYTHLDVYKRQAEEDVEVDFSMDDELDDFDMDLGDDDLAAIDLDDEDDKPKDGE